MVDAVMTAVMQQPRQTRLVPQPGESQVDFVVRGNRALYSKIPDATKRNRHILRLWREAGRDGDLDRMVAERFPTSEFRTIHDSPIFVEHSTIGSDGKRRVYDRSALSQIVQACNDRIRDTGDFAVLSGGHTPDDPTSTEHRTPETLGFVGPFRLGMIGNLRPRWAVFADEHHLRADEQKISKLPRRSAEVWLEDNILDPIAALGAETPRLDTGIVRNCRLPTGRLITKYSGMASSPCGVNTAPPTFAKRREQYAAGENDMDMNSGDDSTALNGLGDDALNQIIQGVANQLMQSRVMQFVISQMPPDWTPNEPEADDIAGDDLGDEIPPEHADQPADDLGDGAGLGDDGLMAGGDEAPAPVAAAPAESADVAGEAPPDVGAATAGEYPEDEATGDEIGQMDDEDKERYAAHDSAGRKGFLQAWRKHRHHKSLYSAGHGVRMNTQKDNYSRLATENAALKNRVDQLEAQNRHKDRYGRLAQLRRQHAFNLESEVEDTKDLTNDQFEKHCQRIKTNYSRIPVGESGFSEKLPVPELVEGDEPAKDKYSRRAKEIADAAIKANPKRGMSWGEALEKARQEIDGAATVK